MVVIVGVGAEVAPTAKNASVAAVKAMFVVPIVVPVTVGVPDTNE